MKKPQQNLAILFADIANSTQYYQLEGDVEAHRQVAHSLALMADAITSHGGEVLRTVGDSTLASFSHSDNALQAASAMQEMHKISPLSIRAGFHFGPVIPDKGDVYGNAVNIAARVTSYARAEEIFATEQSVACLSQPLRTRVKLLDNISVKGVTEPIAIYRIDWDIHDEQQTRIAENPTIPSIQTCQVRLEFAEHTIDLNEADGSFTVGRDLDCTLTINGDRVSRHHANIQCVQGQVILTDTSTNGSFLHRHRQSPLFVRRESVVVEGSGAIGFGCLPEEDATTAMRFKV